MSQWSIERRLDCLTAALIVAYIGIWLWLQAGWCDARGRFFGGEGVLGVDYPACQQLANEALSEDDKLYPPGFLLESFFRHIYVRAMPDWERALLTLQLAVDPHGMDINPGFPPGRR